jgi:hypothetical protein
LHCSTRVALAVIVLGAIPDADVGHASHHPPLSLAYIPTGHGGALYRIRRSSHVPATTNTLV